MQIPLSKALDAVHDGGQRKFIPFNILELEFLMLRYYGTLVNVALYTNLLKVLELFLKC